LDVFHGFASLPLKRVRPQRARDTRHDSVRPLVTALFCAALPVVGLVELALAEWQKRRVPTDADWVAAATAAKAAKRPEDWIIVAPAWAGPLGRKAIGSVDAKLIDLASVARSDLDTVPRVLELSIRGKDDPQTKGWKLVDEQRFGTVKLRTLENPRPDKLVRDLVSEIGPSLSVARVNVQSGASDPCRWETGGTRIPNLFTGPATPYDRFLCAPWDPLWTFVGITTITDLDYNPRRCLLMHPTDNTYTTINYPPGKIGTKVVAYLGIHVFQERDLNKPPVHTRVSVGDKEIAHAKHKDGDGWLRFEGSTAEFAGQTQPVKIETWVEGVSQFRLACIAAQLRE
jgi:hypothetical protein